MTPKYTELIFCECGFNGYYGQHQDEVDKGIAPKGIEHAFSLQ